MAENTKIEWAHHTFNPWLGCTKVSPACDGCYAESWAKRVGRANLWNGDRQRTTPNYWAQPLKWDRDAAKAGRRPRVFCASLADVFDNQVPDEWREDLWDLIRRTPNLDWLLLTKRPQNMAKMVPPDWPLQNVWLGTTVENQTEANRRIPYLLGINARVRFLSMEPLLGPVDLTHIVHPAGVTFIYNSLSRAEVHHGLDWIIVGGESGGNARPMHPNWARQLRDDCQRHDVAFHFKQWGEWAPLDVTAMLARADAGRKPRRREIVEDLSNYPTVEMVHMERLGKRLAGRALDGAEHNGVPA